MTHIHVHITAVSKTESSAVFLQHVCDWWFWHGPCMCLIYSWGYTISIYLSHDWKNTATQFENTLQFHLSRRLGRGGRGLCKFTWQPHSTEAHIWRALRPLETRSRGSVHKVLPHSTLQKNHDPLTLVSTSLQVACVRGPFVTSACFFLAPDSWKKTQHVASWS